MKAWGGLTAGVLLIPLLFAQSPPASPSSASFSLPFILPTSWSIAVVVELPFGIGIASSV